MIENGVNRYTCMNASVSSLIDRILSTDRRHRSLLPAAMEYTFIAENVTSSIMPLQTP